MKNDKKKKGLLLSALGTGIASVGLMIAAAVTPAHEIGNDNAGDSSGNGSNKIILPEEEISHPSDDQSFFDKIPVFLRSIISIPLVLLGTLLMKLINAALKVVVAPVISFLLGWLGIFLILMVIILLILKLLFPDKKLRELINVKLIVTVLIGSFIIRLSQVVLPNIWNSYKDYEFAITFLLGLTVVMIVIIPAVIKKRREPKIIYSID